jgi:hypothetical protein
LGADALAGLACFGTGFGAGLGFGGTGPVTVFVMVCVVDEPGEEVDEPTQTVTDPEPNFEPWLRPEPEDPELQAIAKEASKFTKAVAIRTLANTMLAR